MASNIYTAPGVSVQEFTSPSIDPLLATPASVALVGKAEGTVRRTDAVKLTGTTATVLPSISALGASTVTMASGAIVKVVSATSPSAPDGTGNGYSSGDTGYDFDNSAKTVARGASSTISDGDTVYVTYDYTPTDYWLPVRMDNMADIEARYGSPYNTAGTAINSQLSYAAAVAFENGAQDVILLPVSYNNAGTRQQVVAGTGTGGVANATTWSDSLTLLRDINDINIIVPVIGQSVASVSDTIQANIINAFQDHAKFMKDQQQYVFVIAGEDGTDTGDALMATLRTHAVALAGRYGGELAEQTVLVSPSKFVRTLPTTAATGIIVGGQYAAAGIAGMLASRATSQPLTRKPVSGFAAVGESRLKSDKNLDAASGLMVLEQKGGLVQVRHSITVSTTSTVTREISVVRAKHRVVESVRETIEEQIIGQVVADGEAPLVVRSAVIGVLEELRLQDDIVDYGDVQARTKSLDPTEIEVRFSYRPAFPVNYVSIGFSLDLTTGDLDLATTGNVDTSTF
jgi:hypothetical protein